MRFSPGSIGCDNVFLYGYLEFGLAHGFLSVAKFRLRFRRRHPRRRRRGWRRRRRSSRRRCFCRRSGGSSRRITAATVFEC